MSDIEGRDPNGPYRVEVIADSSGVWAGNGVRFSSIQAARECAQDLMMRWTLVREWRVLCAQSDGSPDQVVQQA